MGKTPKDESHVRASTRLVGSSYQHVLASLVPNRRLLLLLFYVLGCIQFINRETINSVVPLPVQVFAFAFNLCFLSALLMLLKMFKGPVRALGIATLLAFFGLYLFSSVYHFLLFGQPIGLSSVFALLDTDVKEAGEFVVTFYRLDFFVLSLLAALPIVLLGCSAGNVRKLDLPYRFAAAPLLLLLACMLVLLVDRVRETGSNLGIIHGNPILLSSKLTLQTVGEKRKFTEAMRQFEHVGSVQIAEAPSGPATHILILGESTTSRHMSLYGYGRKTTPRLDEMKNSLHVAADVCSSRTQTIPALNELLTFATRENHELLYQAPNLIQVLKAAGFKTYWISNQAAVGKYETWAQVLARTADEQKFVNMQTFGQGVSLDSRVLPPLRSILNNGDEKRFVIVHLLGTHAAYAHRYPADFEHFSGTSDIPPSVRSKWRLEKSAELYNQYDNAIRYNDYIVAEVLEMVRGLDRASLTFLSDHGEVVGDEGDYFGHVGEAVQRAAYEVPLVFWISPALADTRKNVESIFRRNLSTAFQTDELKFTLLDLYQVGLDLQRKDRSLFSPDFKPKARRCDALQGEAGYRQMTVQK